MTNNPNPPSNPYPTATIENPPEAAETAPEPAATERPASPARPRLRDRVLGFRGVLAVALAALILGGLGGTAIGMATSGDGDRHGPSDGQWPGGDHPGGRPGMMPNDGMPPTVPREDESTPDESITPSAPAGSGTNS